MCDARVNVNARRCAINSTNRHWLHWHSRCAVPQGNNALQCIAIYWTINENVEEQHQGHFEIIASFNWTTPLLMSVTSCGICVCLSHVARVHIYQQLQCSCTARAHFNIILFLFYFIFFFHSLNVFAHIVPFSTALLLHVSYRQWFNFRKKNQRLSFWSIFFMIIESSVTNYNCLHGIFVQLRRIDYTINHE